MNLRNSSLVAVGAVVVIIIGAVLSIRSCGKLSPSGGLREYMGRQHCLACGHEWRMDLADWKKERDEDPTGNRFTHCPKCDAWRGVGIGSCAECGKRIPKIIAYEAEDGSITCSYRRLCDKCAEKHGGQPMDARERFLEGQE